MTMNILRIPAAAFLVLAACFARAEELPNTGREGFLKARLQIVKAWQDMCFGMFLCWGPVTLTGQEIGIWASPGRDIARACFENADGQLGFCVEPEPPTVVYFGRERYNQYNWRGIYYLSWSGIDLELEAPQTLYRYRIVLEAQ